MIYNFSKISDNAIISKEFLLIFNTLLVILKSSKISTLSSISLLFLNICINNNKIKIIIIKKIFFFYFHRLNNNIILYYIYENKKKIYKK